MELKDFIKQVLFDISNAVKESQEELKDVAVVNPPHNDGGHGPMMRKYFYEQRLIEFNIAVAASTEREGHTGVKVMSALLGDVSKNTTNKEISRITFSIPVYLSKGLPQGFDTIVFDVPNGSPPSCALPTGTVEE